MRKINQVLIDLLALSVNILFWLNLLSDPHIIMTSSKTTMCTMPRSANLMVIVNKYFNVQ